MRDKWLRMEEYRCIVCVVGDTIYAAPIEDYDRVLVEAFGEVLRPSSQRFLDAINLYYNKDFKLDNFI